MSDRDNTYDVPVEAQKRILGFPPAASKSDITWNRVALDPVVCERRSAVINGRRALLGELANNIYAPQYKSVPFRTTDPSATDLKNIDIGDPASTFGLVMAMTEVERRELRDRVRDDKLQEGLFRASNAAPLDKHGISLFYKMTAEQKLAAARALA